MDVHFYLLYILTQGLRKVQGKYCAPALDIPPGVGDNRLMKEITVGKNDANQRLDRFVGKAVPLLPESLLQKYIRLKRIKLNGKGAKRDTRVQVGDVLSLYINDEFFEPPREEN